MKLQITDEDIEEAYKGQKNWWLTPEKTPIAVALSKILGKDVWVGYDSIQLATGSVVLPVDAKAYQRAFGLSLYSNLDPHRASVIKELHKTNSDFKSAVEMPKKADRVKPATFELDVEVP